MRVAVIGATGLIGRRLVGALVSRGDEAVAVVRSGEVVEAERTVLWNGAGPLPAGAFADCDAVVNLAGAPIARRWSAQVRREIVAMRTAPPGCRILVPPRARRPGSIWCSTSNRSSSPVGSSPA